MVNYIFIEARNSVTENISANVFFFPFKYQLKWINRWIHLNPEYFMKISRLGLIVKLLKKVVVHKERKQWQSYHGGWTCTSDPDCRFSINCPLNKIVIDLSLNCSDSQIHSHSTTENFLWSFSTLTVRILPQSEIIWTLLSDH